MKAGQNIVKRYIFMLFYPSCNSLLDFDQYRLVVTSWWFKYLRLFLLSANRNFQRKKEERERRGKKKNDNILPQTVLVRKLKDVKKKWNKSPIRYSIHWKSLTLTSLTTGYHHGGVLPIKGLVGMSRWLARSTFATGLPTIGLHFQQSSRYSC